MPGPHAIGVDVGGTKILSGVVTREGEVLRRYEIATPTGSQDELLAALEGSVAAVREDDVCAVGFGIPSPIEHRTGTVVRSVNIPLAQIALRDVMAERLALPVALENDANAATLAEHRAGAGRGVDTMVMLTLGTGCGGGVVVDGRLFRGWAELGHTVVEIDGRPCQGTCTGRGHLEPYVTGLAATAAAREAFGPAADAHRLVRLADEGEEQAVGILHGIGHYLGAGIGSLVNVFAPELVVIGGGFGTAAFDHLVGPALEVARREALAPAGERLRIERAELATGAGLIGAAFVAFEAADAA